MNSRETRTLLLVVVVAGGAAGVVLETLLDPLESANLAWLGLLVGLSVVGVLGGGWYARARRSVDGPDERFRRIELRASRVGHGLLAGGVAVLAPVQLLPWAELPVGWLLLGLLVGSVVVHELSIEYYRRRM